MTLHVVIPGKPIPKGRPRVVNGRAYTPKATVAYERHAKACVRAGVMVGRWERLVVGDVHVRIKLVFSNRTHGDVDNVSKAVLDAANGVAFADDRQVARLTVWREYDKANPRAELWVSEAEEAGP